MIERSKKLINRSIQGVVIASMLTLSVSAVPLTMFGESSFASYISVMPLIQKAYAHQDPAGCTNSPSQVALLILRDTDNNNEGDAPISAGGVLIEGETVYYQGRLDPQSTATDCSREGGSISITTPDGSNTDVTPAGGIPCLGNNVATNTDDVDPPAPNGPNDGTAPDGDDCDADTDVDGNARASIFSNQVPYTVDCDDKTASGLQGAVSYQGFLHINDDDTGTATATSNIFNPCASTMLTKTANATNINVGDTVKFTYTETNDGTVTLKNVKIIDDQCPDPSSLETPVSGDTDNDNMLDPGESWVFECEVTFNSPGTFTNTAYGYAETDDGTVITHPEKNGTDPDEKAEFTVTVEEPIKPDIDVEKTCMPPVQQAPGEITWKITVTNVGNEDLVNVSVIDSMHGNIFSGSLAVGESKNFEFVDSDLENGTYENTVKAEGTGSTSNSTVTNIDTAVCVVITPPVGGEPLPIDRTALLINGIAANVYWIIAIIGGAITTIMLRRF